MKHRYQTKVTVEDGVEETQFIPQGAAPRLRTRYIRDAKDHGKYKDGREYAIDPESLDGPIEEAFDDPAVEAQRDQEKAAEKPARKGRKRTSKKAAE